MAARKHRENHNVEQTEKMIPLVTRKTPFGWNVSKLVFGVNTFDLDLWFQINSVEQPIKRNSVVSGHVSHCWTSFFDDHLDDSFVVFKNVQLRLAWRRMCVGVYEIHIWHLLNLFAFSFQLMFWSCFYSWNGLLSRTTLLGLVCLVLQRCLLNVTLQLPRPKGREQVIHPFAIQHPTK